MEERVPQVFENEFTFPDGTKRWFELRVQPAPEGICVTQPTSTSESGGSWRRRATTGRPWSCGCGDPLWDANRLDPAIDNPGKPRQICSDVRFSGDERWCEP